MWVPRWVGEAYALLYEEFGLGPFGLNEAENVLSTSTGMVKAALSRLHKESLLMVFKEGRPRSYRLMDPENFMVLASGKVNRISIKQERYLKLIYDCYRALRKALSLTSLAVYGSVARGTAGDTSDLDLLVISDDFKGTLGERLDGLQRVNEEVKEEVRFLRRNGIHTFLSFYPLRREEAERMPIVMLDMVEDVKIVYDEDGFLEKQLLRLKLRLVELGAKRVELKDGRWYWDLSPGHRPLEALPL
jgi:hypothetical protein